VPLVFGWGPLATSQSMNPSAVACTEVHHGGHVFPQKHTGGLLSSVKGGTLAVSCLCPVSELCLLAGGFIVTLTKLAPLNIVFPAQPSLAKGSGK
jgi:hypothetical protein